MARLRLINLFKRYENSGKGRKKKKNDFAVNDFSLDIADGEFVGILGPSGCGKTTTLRMIAGLEEITDGKILIDDTVINNLHPKDRNIGLAFEDYALYPPLTVYDNVAFNLRAKGMPENLVKEKIEKIAPLMKINDLLQQKPTNLSGGQKQRVNIARAIVREPKLLLLDEPLSHLDGKMRQVLRTEIKRLHYEIQCTTIIVTHDQLEAMSLADKIVVMKDGVLQQYGTPLEIYDDPVNEFVAGFIGEPPMNLVEVIVEKDNNDFLFSLDNGRVRIPVPTKYYSVVTDGMHVDLGIRPTDLQVGSIDGKGSKVAITVYENLGDEKRINIRIGDSFLMLITDSEKKYKAGDVIKLEVNENKTHLFDIESGERIRAK
ncbi:MAG: ABC transporter ATP-binding protein [Flexilinea sp.]